ncbi:MAG: GGDEF domain-containing protein [Granulosicoccus sp.]
MSILVPAAIAPNVTYFLTRLLSRLDTAYEFVTKLSTTDSLTGTANRRGFLGAATQNIRTLREATECMVGMVDLDKFKEVNDTYGHNVGDEALAVAATLLKKTVGEIGVVGRLGGDEFALIALGSPSELEDLRSSIIGQCSNFTIQNDIAISCSIGNVLLNKNESIDAVLARADRALYSVKEKRIGRFGVAKEAQIRSSCQSLG